MPVSAAYEIELSAEERAELEHRAACYTLPFRQIQRARLVLYAAAGQTNREIAGRLEMNEEVVGRWRRRFHAERLEGLEDRARSGRPRSFPPGRGDRGEGGGLRASAHAGRHALALLSH
jgi:hypothetical protein